MSKFEKTLNSMTISEKAINVKNLHKTYRNGLKALSGVSFDIDYGEIFGLLGPNGAGKSSTIRILATLSKMSSGKVKICGKTLKSNEGDARKNFGYVAQSSGVDQWATGKENLILQAQMERVPNKLIDLRVTELLDWMNLIEASSKLVKSYSGGMKRRLEIAMGLIHQPKILFLDEPTAGLDPESRKSLWLDLKRLQKEQKMTVLITTHYLEEADYLCDRIAIIDQGIVITEGTPEYLKADISGDTITLKIHEKLDVALPVIQSIEGVTSVSKNDQYINVKVTNGSKLIPKIISLLEKKLITVNSLSYSNPSLDDVYFKHTGKHYTAKDAIKNIK